eukprot:193615_1
MEDALHAVDNLLHVFDVPPYYYNLLLKVDIEQYKKDTQQLKQSLQQYYQTAQVNNDTTITDTLNNYISLMMQARNNDDVFENIYEYVNMVCDPNQCEVIKRRNAKKSTLQIHENIMDKVVQEIMDKIHCYLIHSYDNGYRLNSKDIQMSNKIVVQEKQNNPFFDSKKK